MKDLVEIIPDYAEKVGNMNAKALAARDAESAGYAHYMAQMLKASEAQREENKKLVEIRRQRHGIDPHAQQPSTMAILARDPKDDEKHWLRHLPEGVQIRDKDGNIDVAPRPVSVEEISHIESIRHRPKNSVGQSEKSGTSEKTRELAIDAYLYSPGIEFKDLSKEDQQRVTELSPYSELPSVPAPETPKVTDKKFWLYGHYLELKNWLKR